MLLFLEYICIILYNTTKMLYESQVLVDFVDWFGSWLKHKHYTSSKMWRLGLKEGKLKRDLALFCFVKQGWVDCAYHIWPIDRRLSYPINGNHYWLFFSKLWII